MRVLIIDDEEDTRSIFSMSLNLLGGVEVLEAESGAFGLVKAVQEKPDVIVLDLLMPDMDGTATFYGLKQNPLTRHIPVIFMTVKGMFSEFDALKALGALAVIAKPFDPTTLTDQIKKILTANGYGHVAGNGACVASIASEQSLEPSVDLSGEPAAEPANESIPAPACTQVAPAAAETKTGATAVSDAMPVSAVDAASAEVGAKSGKVPSIAHRRKMQAKSTLDALSLVVKSCEQLGSVKPVPVARKILARKKQTKLR
jgi:CheY-like chemotaxis protein